MKKTSVIAISLAVLCFVMCTVLVGCSDDNGATAGDQTEVVQATQSTETAAAATEAPAAATEAPVAETTEAAATEVPAA